MQITMAPIASSDHVLTQRMVKVTKPTDPETLIVEAWAQGFMVGSILIMLCITISNYRHGVLLHKLILLEVRGTLIHDDRDNLTPHSSSLVLSMALLSSMILQCMAGISQ